MGQKRLPTSMNPEIRISQVLGDLRITGWGEAEVTVDADLEDLKAEVQDNILSLSCPGDCSLHVPRSALLHIESAHGDASLKYLDEPVSVQAVFGSLSLVNLGGASLDSVHGDLTVKGIRGDLQVKQIYGEAYLRSIQGQCVLKQVLGNLDLRDAGGNIEVNVKGNARLRLSQASGARYVIEADGNVHCHIPEDASLTLKLSSREQVIRIKLPHETKTERASQSELVLGSGEKKMDLSAGGVLYLFVQSLDWGETEFPFDNPIPEDFSQQIAQQVQAQIDSQMEAINRQVSEQMANLTEQVSKSNLPPEQVQRIIDQARLTSEREMERSQHKLRRAQEKMERKLEAARRRQERTEHSYHGRSWNFNFSPRPRASAAAAENATDEEQLVILRMLAQKKISPEEADQLLSALESK